MVRGPLGAKKASRKEQSVIAKLSTPEAIAAARELMANGPCNMAPSYIIAPNEDMVDTEHEVDFFVEPGVTCRLGGHTCIVTTKRSGRVWNSKWAPRGQLYHRAMTSVHSRKKPIIDMLLKTDLNWRLVADELTEEFVPRDDEEFVALLWQVRRFVCQLMADSEELFTAN